ncbi:unnamed protein product [Bemisia tabaci]|uniref:Uncharacterized protein n=1 Tax=Bemisia tabaci TaxID=7038 RepID=A0A9P0A1I9_BEMTA|nr:unnamed protein product [Bemisia tabaci]
MSAAARSPARPLLYPPPRQPRSPALFILLMPLTNQMEIILHRTSYVLCFDHVTRLNVSLPAPGPVGMDMTSAEPSTHRSWYDTTSVGRGEDAIDNMASSVVEHMSSLFVSHHGAGLEPSPRDYRAPYQISRYYHQQMHSPYASAASHEANHYYLARSIFKAIQMDFTQNSSLLAGVPLLCASFACTRWRRTNACPYYPEQPRSFNWSPSFRVYESPLFQRGVLDPLCLIAIWWQGHGKSDSVQDDEVKMHASAGAIVPAML